MDVSPVLILYTNQHKIIHLFCLNALLNTKKENESLYYNIQIHRIVSCFIKKSVPVYTSG